MKKKLFLIFALPLLLALAVGVWIFRAHVTLGEDQYPEYRVYIPTGSSYESLCDSLNKCCNCHPPIAFSLFAHLRRLPDHIKGGSYLIQDGMTVLQLVNKLNSGAQDAINITINKHRTPQQLCNFLGQKLEFPADSLLVLMQDSSVCASYGETPQTILGIFPQNTYQVYWTTSPRKLLDRMKQESDRFWDSRQKALQALNLSRQQVIILASIVEEETNANDEKADIASVYLNRLRLAMPLQADPTVKYAIGDFTIRRILTHMLQTDSPYNTYLHRGLPPGPICIPSVSSIDAVLKNKKTDYLYFCAKEDFSGKHNFSSTLAEHQRNAARFHKALNEKQIR